MPSVGVEDGVGVGGEGVSVGCAGGDGVIVRLSVEIEAGIATSARVLVGGSKTSVGVAEKIGAKTTAVARAVSEGRGIATAGVV